MRYIRALNAAAAAVRVLSLAPIAFTLLPITRTGAGFVRIWDFPRVQIAVLGLLAHAAFRRYGGNRPVDRALEAVLAACNLYQASKIWPYTSLHSKQVITAHSWDPKCGIRLFNMNVLMDNRSSGQMLELIAEADPDVICLLETDAWWEQQMRPLESRYQWRNKCALENTYGMLLYSRLPLHETETRFLVESDVPSMRTMVELRSGDRVKLHCLHPRPPLPNSPSYGRDAELVIAGRELAEEHLPAIVIGDLNDVAWSFTTELFQKISGTLDPRIGRGMFDTFHAKIPLLRYPLDHVFHTPDFRVASMRRMGNAGSDHFSICVELVYSPHTEHLHEEPEATADDHEAADEVLEDAREEGFLPAS